MAIQVTGALAINTETGAKVDLAIIYKKFLAIELSKNVTLKNATITNIDQLNAGTAIYMIGLRLGTQTYGAIGSPNPTNQTAYRTVQIPLDLDKEINFGANPFDLKKLGATFQGESMTIGEAALNSWLEGKAKAYAVYISAKLTQLAITTAQNNGLVQITLPSTPDPTAADYRNNVWLPLADIVADMETLINAEVAGGLNPDDFHIWITPRFANRFIMSSATLGSDQSYNALVDGEVRRIGTLKWVKDTLLGQNIPAGGVNVKTTGNYNNSIDQNEAFDLTGCHFIIIHKEALAFPFCDVLDQDYPVYTDGSMKWLKLFSVNNEGGRALLPYAIKGGVFITPLPNIIMTLDLGNIITTGGVAPTSTQLETAIKLRNPAYQTGMATFSAITTTTATATGVNAQYTTGTVNLTYTVSTPPVVFQAKDVKVTRN